MPNYKWSKSFPSTNDSIRSHATTQIGLVEKFYSHTTSNHSIYPVYTFIFFIFQCPFIYSHLFYFNYRISHKYDECVASKNFSVVCTDNVLLYSTYFTVLYWAFCSSTDLFPVRGRFDVCVEVEWLLHIPAFIFLVLYIAIQFVQVNVRALCNCSVCSI